MTPVPYDARTDGDFGERPRVVGLIVDEERGSLPYHLIHGEGLVAAAAWAAGEAGIELVDLTTPWDDVVAMGVPLVLHDPLCPMTPPEFLVACARVALDRDVVAVGVRPVTDTVKQVAAGQLGATVDRDGLVIVCSPIVLPPAVVADLDGPPMHDFAALVTDLRTSYDVELVEAPATARRVATDEDLLALEALTDPR